MNRSALRDLIQPALQQDFDALFDEFTTDLGREDPAAFVMHLQGFGLITEVFARDVRKAIRSAPVETFVEIPASPPPDATWIEEDAPRERVAIPRSATPAPPPARGTPRSPRRTPAPAVRNPTAATPAGQARVELPRRRTLFRRVSDGSLSEAEEAQPGNRESAAAPQSQRYEFLAIVGEGAMGRVHLVEDRVLNRKAAFKQMGEDVAREPALASKFTSEARITAQLDHPNIVPIYDLDGDTAYTMKLVGGRTLQDIIAEARDDALTGRPDRHTRDALLELFLRVCDGISYANARGIVHRDIKPENIMVGAFGEVYVMDWGIARRSADLVPEPVRVPPEADEGDLIMGTPGYMSPEQASGLNDTLDGRSDAYSLGLLLFELVSLRPAVTGRTALAQVIRHQEGELDPFVHVAGKRQTREITAIVERATKRETDQRYASVVDLADEVRRHLRGDPILARPDGPIDSVFRWMAKHREATAFVVTAFTMTTVVLVFTIVVWTQLQLAASEAREQRLSSLLSTIARQASSIDGQFLKYEGLLSVIATSATDRLFGSTGTGAAVHPSADFDAPGVVTLIDAPRYKRSVSLSELAFEPNPATWSPAGARQAASLGPLARRFYEVLLRSHSEEAATWTTKRAQRAISEVGVPVAYAWVGTEEGIFAVYPGHGGFPAGFDHRALPSYAMAIGHHGPAWGAPTADPSGVGLTLACAQGLFDAEDHPIGVVGVDVTFDYLIEHLLVPEEFAGRDQINTYLLDPSGRVVVDSRRPAASAALVNGVLHMPDFDVPAVVRAVKERRSGYVRVADATPERLIIYNRMGSIGWYYVVDGTPAVLLGR